MLRKQGPGRFARRAASLAWSSAIQATGALSLAAIVSAMSSSAPPEPLQRIEVKFVKGAPRPAPLPMATPPAPPPPPRRKVARAPGPAAPAPLPQLVQPRSLPDQLAPPGPEEPPAPEPAAATPTVVGGVIGGAAGAELAPPSRLAFDGASMTRPVFVSGPAPTYTRAALEREVEGAMLVACVITRDGLVRECQVQQGLPFMDAAVVQALQLRRYRPATLRGEPVEVTYLFRINLRLPR